jgi:hypothetical protein
VRGATTKKVSSANSLVRSHRRVADILRMLRRTNSGTRYRLIDGDSS